MNSMPVDDFAGYDGLDLAEVIRSKGVSPTELAEVVIKRIEAMNPTLNFMATADFERARARASAPPAPSRFAGVPILVKDMIDVGGLRHTDGSRLMAERIPAKSVAYIEAVEKSGFNIVGNTNVPEFAGYIMTANNLFGATRNPWDLAYSTFASSGGTAAAVAAGVVPIAHGTDGAGSNRLPASATGIFGFKPSRGRMLSGEADGSHDISKTNNMMSRTVRDNAAAFDLTEAKTGGEYRPVGFVEGPSTQRLRIGYVSGGSTLMPIEAGVREAQADVADQLAGLGHQVEEAPWPVNDQEMLDNYVLFFAGKMRGVDAAVRKANGKSPLESGLLTPFIASFLESEEFAVPDAEIAVGRTYLLGLGEVFRKVFANYDVLLTPVSPVICPRLDEGSPDDLWSEQTRNFVGNRLQFTSPINFAGIPAMSVPLSVASQGMPIGSHFIAGHGQERRLYELAYELEQARPWAARRPPHGLL